MLTITARAYLLVLLAYAAYTTYVLGRILHRLRRSRQPTTSDDGGREPWNLGRLAENLESVRQFNTFIFLLFGVDLSLETLAMIRTIVYMAMSLSAATIGVFGPLARFALFAMLVLTYLHVAQWFISAQLSSVARE